MNKDSVVIINGARTPMGGLLGARSTIPAPELAATAISATLARSGMQAAILGYDSIIAGTNTAVIAGGMESMSCAPHMLPGARGGIGSGHKSVCDHMFMDGLEDAYTGRAMGSFAQETADQRGITRQQMYALRQRGLRRGVAALRIGGGEATAVAIELE